MLCALLAGALAAPRLFVAPPGALPPLPRAGGPVPPFVAVRPGLKAPAARFFPDLAVRARPAQMFDRGRESEGRPRSPARTTTVGSRRQPKATIGESPPPPEGKELDGLEDAWARYVLLRPGMDLEQLRNSTRLRTAQSWTWQERTPGTARTLLFTVVTITLFAVPVLLANPQILSRLLGTVALSLEGRNPTEYYVSEATEAVPQVASIFNATLEFIMDIFRGSGPPPQ